MIPVNLINEIKGVGFDYGLTAREVADRVVAGHQVLWEKELSVALEGVGRSEQKISHSASATGGHR